MDTTKHSAVMAEDIAIVGMSVNVPGAEGVDAYWANLRDGVESIRRLTEEELLAAGETAQNIARQNYVPAAAVLDGFDTFDPEFFGFSPKDAAILDPQHRKFLEVAWQAMEQGGHPPESLAGPIGVYAGCGMGSYFYFNICSNPALVDDVGMFLLRHTGNDKDFLSTRVSHVFDLKGPSINLQTACSTSLVAIHYACQALHAGEVDMALAGGVTIELPQGRGYLFKENEILSPDGHCHAFDHRAQGTVFGSGAGAVALRRLSDAIADGDHIWAVIKGSAVNNDGAAKAGYLAPSVDGQTQAIAQALKAAGVAAQSIGMVECHGTGTYLGDPIEVAALTEAYRAETNAVDFARIGSVKTNIGHLDTAAGVAGLAKAALSLHHKQIPPSLGYEAPNPAIAFEDSPFRVNDNLHDWPASDTPRRAAINALGVGGTNAHAILEEAPVRAASEESDWPFHALCLSGHSKAALEANTASLAEHLRAHPDQPLADVAHTLKNGRRGFAKRRVVVAETHAEAATLLEAGDTRRVFTHEVLGDNPEVVFMFPGGGAQYAGMAQDLYETEPVFAEWMDKGLSHLQPHLDYDIRALWLPDAVDADAARETLKKPSVQLPLIAIVEYALAQLWMSWGVKPSAMVGHSMGENVAACLAGVMRFEDLIDLVLLRGRLFDEVPEGGMISISAPLETIEPLLGSDLDIASVNATELIAVSGSQSALAAMQSRLDAADIEYQRIAIDIAAHSRMLGPILDRYRAFLANLDLQAPQMPFASNRSGQMITAQEATDPDYWVGQLRNTVNFADCITTLAAPRKRVFLEVGPGKALSALAQMNADVAGHQVISTLRHPDHDVADDAYFVSMIARLWGCGVEADWAQIWGEARRNRVILPTYQFQRSRFFIEPGQSAEITVAPEISRLDDMSDWGAVSAWRPQYADCDMDVGSDLHQSPLTWLMFMDEGAYAAPIATRLTAAGHRVIKVRPGDAFSQEDEDAYVLAPEQGRMGYDALIAALSERDIVLDRIAHFWLADDLSSPRPGSSVFDRNVERGFWSLTWLAQALSEAGIEASLHINVFTTGAVQVGGEPLHAPEKALVRGPVGVFAREMPGVTTALIDLEAVLKETTASRGWFGAAVGEQVQAPTPDTDGVLEELMATPQNQMVAVRGEKRFQQTYRTVALPQTQTPLFKENGVYVLTGGLGGIAQTLAADILTTSHAHVVLVGRGKLPARAAWQGYLTRNGTSDATARRIQAALRLEEIAKASGATLEVASADVANLAQMRRVLDDVQARRGRITGVIHAAGVLDDAPLLAKTDAAIEAVLAPKVQGVRVLDQLLPDGAVDWMVLFSSTSTATMSAGQTDYVAANAWLNAFAAYRSNGKTRVTAVNWGIWSDVGMAASAIQAGGCDTLPPRAVDVALLQTVQTDKDGRPVFNAHLRSDNWVLDQHRTKDGQALLPGTGYIELLAEAAQVQGLTTGFEIQDLYFLRAMPVDDGSAADIEIQLRREANGFAAEISSACSFDGKAGWQLHAQATFAPLAYARAETCDINAIKARCPQVQRAGDMGRIASPQEAHLRFGPHWHVVQETYLGAAEGVAALSLPADVRDSGQLLHAGLMDLATGWAIGLAPGYDGSDLWVPLSYGSVRVYQPLGDEIYTWVRLSSENNSAGFVRFDVTICDREGSVLVEVRDFAMKRLEGSFGTTPLTASEVRFEDASDDTMPMTAAEERLAYLVSQGIRASEGPEALRRAVDLGRSQIMVSSLPLDGLIAQASQPVQTTTEDTQSFERPDLDGSFVAPRTSIETALAEMWENLLGVSPVGVEDSFFDLGGHSLIAVRLFAQVKRSFKVEFPISVLFEAPTIAKCAALIAAQTGDTDDAGGTSTAPNTLEPRLEFLVPLNQSTQKDAPPLFVVAGMFGNVLNLRHLALPFSAERRVFGVQAKGLIGDTDPHRDVYTAARDYLAEIRKVQPKGPYLLGGYSGGGIMAYEMAQQLRAQGEEVASLALLDTPLPVRPALTARDKVAIKLTEIQRKGPGYLIEWLQARRAWNQAQKEGTALATPEGAFNNDKIRDAFLAAVGSYQTPNWDGAITLFRPPLDRHWKVSGDRWVTAEKEYLFADNDWTRYAPNIRVVEVPGDHDSMVLAPNVTVLAQELSEIIADALDIDEEDAFRTATAAE